MVEELPLAGEARRFRVSSAQIAVLALVLGLLVGAGAVWMLLLPPAEASHEVIFARDMSVHHAQAVEMAQIIRDRSPDPELRQLALDIMQTQQAQIGQMQGWLAVWGRSITGTVPPMSGMGEAMGMATAEQVAALSTLPVDQAEVSFLQLLIRHHQGAIAMAEHTSQQRLRPEVARLVGSIIQGQQSEITYMRELLTKRGAAPLPDLNPNGAGMQMGN